MSGKSAVMGRNLHFIKRESKRKSQIFSSQGFAKFTQEVKSSQDSPDYH